MCSDYLHSKKYRVTLSLLTLFLILSIGNLFLMPKILTYAEESESGPPVESAENVLAAETVEPTTETSTEVIETDEPLETDIETGDAIANVNVVNEVNVNEVNSETNMVTLGDSLGGESLDLREIINLNNSTTTATSTCTDCISSTTLSNQNFATITNVLNVTADTGNNTSSSTTTEGAASSTIITGNAYAGSNVVNVVNTNIVDSKYFLLVFNNFGDWSGDLVFPNANFFDNFLSLFNPECDCQNSDTFIANDNSAEIINDINTSSNTGNNESWGNIDTGNAFSYSNSLNLVNKNMYNDSSFYLVVKVFGDWKGDIFNLPPGIAWGKTEGGIVLYNEQSGIPNTSGASGGISILSSSTANIINDIQVSANTGDNIGGSIETGNAYAGSNTVNIANTNIISSNWMAALVNIFGDWNGNISFGQPDLWVGLTANIEGKAEAGSSVFFKATIKNKGDARASDINILSRLKTTRFTFTSTYSDYNLLHLDSLEPGETKEFDFVGYIDRFAHGENIVIETNISSLETDGNIKDNKDQLSFVATFNPGSMILPQNHHFTTYPDISITKTHMLPNSVVVDGVEMVPAGASVDFEIVVKNNGGEAYDSTLFDKLVNEEGKIINEQYWELGTILPNEEISVTYSTVFNEKMPAGIYTNYAWVEALSGDSIAGFEKKADSPVVKDVVIVAEKPKVVEITTETIETEGEVLGVVTKDIDLFREEVSKEGLRHEFITGFCFEKTEEEKRDRFNTLGYSQTVLLGLSFMLVMSRRNNLPSNLLLV